MATNPSPRVLQAACHVQGTIIIPAKFDTDEEGYATSGHHLAYYTCKSAEKLHKAAHIYDHVQRYTSDETLPLVVAGAAYTLEMAEADFARFAR